MRIAAGAVAALLCLAGAPSSAGAWSKEAGVAEPTQDRGLFAVAVRGEAQPMVMLGIIAKGAEADIRVFEASATALGIEPGRPEASGASPVETMALFKADSLTESERRLLREASAGTYGPLGIEVILVPIDVVRSGAIPPDRLRAYPASAIVIP